MTKKLTVSELLRLACIYAERDQQELLSAVSRCSDGQEDEIKDYLKQLRKYRLKRWGKTKLEELIANGTPKSIAEIRADHETV